VKEAVVLILFYFLIFLDCLWLDRLWWKNEEVG